MIHVLPADLVLDEPTRRLCADIAAGGRGPVRLAVIAPGGYGKSALLDLLLETPGARRHRRGTALDAGLLLVDDAHLLSDAALAEVADLAADDRLGLVVAARPWPRPAGLTALLARLRGQIVLRPFDHARVAACLGLATGSDHAPGVVAAVHARTGGIPGLVHRLASHLPAGDHFAAEGGAAGGFGHERLDANGRRMSDGFGAGSGRPDADAGAVEEIGVHPDRLDADGQRVSAAEPVAVQGFDLDRLDAHARRVVDAEAGAVGGLGQLDPGTGRVLPAGAGAVRGFDQLDADGRRVLAAEVGVVGEFDRLDVDGRRVLAAEPGAVEGFDRLDAVGRRVLPTGAVVVGGFGQLDVDVRRVLAAEPVAVDGFGQLDVDGRRVLAAELGAVEEFRFDLDRLDADARRVLVAGEAGVAELPGGLLERPVAEVVAEVRAGGLVAADGRPLPVTATAVRALLPAEERAAVFAALAGARLAVGGPVAATATALLAAGASGPAVAALFAAAAPECGPVVAVRLFAAAAAAGHDVDQARWAEAEAGAGDPAAALRRADVLIAHGPEAGRGHAASVAGAALAHRGELARSAELYRWSGTAVSSAFAAIGFVGTGRLDEARIAFKEAENAPPTVLAGAVAATARGVLDSVSGPALSTVVHAAAALEPVGAAALLPDSPAALAALMALHHGDPAAAEAVLDRAIAARVGGIPLAARHRLLRGWAAMFAGDDAIAAGILAAGNTESHGTVAAAPTPSGWATPPGWPETVGGVPAGWPATAPGWAAIAASGWPVTGVGTPSGGPSTAAAGGSAPGRPTRPDGTRTARPTASTGPSAPDGTALGRTAALDGYRSGRDAVFAAGLAVGLARRGSDLGALRRCWEGACAAVARQPVDLFTLLPLGELTVAAARLGDRDRIAPHLDAAWALLARLGDPPLWTTMLHWYSLHAELLAEAPAAAQRHADALRANASAGSVHSVLADAADVWLHVVAGEVDRAAVESAARALHGAGLRWDGARLAGQAAIRTHDRAAMVGLLECARGLQGPTSTPAPDAAGEPTRLSERELQVAGLVLTGMTYRQIGDHLFISAKTVEHHMARMRSRLGASSRAELLARLRELVG